MRRTVRRDTPLPDEAALRSFSGWGRSTRSSSRVTKVESIDDVVTAIRSHPHRGVLARGAGRSYGDAAQNAGGRILDLAALSDIQVSPSETTSSWGAASSCEIYSLI